MSYLIYPYRPYQHTTTTIGMAIGSDISFCLHFQANCWKAITKTLAIRIQSISKHSYIRIFRFRFGSFGLDFLHPNKFLVANIQPKYAKFHFCFFILFPLQKYHFLCKRGEKSSQKFAWTFLYFSSACVFICWLCNVEAETACTRSTMHHLWS